MPTINPPLRQQQYRGLNSAESDILRRYLGELDAEVRRLRTQIKLGPGELPPESQPDALRRQWRESSKLKVDAVVELQGDTQLVELKDLVRTSALGQLLCYRYWFRIERDPEFPVSLHAAAPDINPSAVQPYRNAGVAIHPQSPDGRRHLQQGIAASPPFDGLAPNSR
jgi:hypothetical protein